MAVTGSVELPTLADLRQRYRQQLTSAGYLALLAGVLNLRQSSGGLVCLGLLAVVALAAWVLTYQRARAVSDVATSRIGSAAQGYVELMGRASGGASELLRSPFSATECIWYRYRLYERDSEDDWREVDRGSSTTTFVGVTSAAAACRSRTCASMLVRSPSPRSRALLTRAAVIPLRRSSASRTASAIAGTSIRCRRRASIVRSAVTRGVIVPPAALISAATRLGTVARGSSRRRRAPGVLTTAASRSSSLERLAAAVASLTALSKAEA
jgi:hypothetical protein